MNVISVSTQHSFVSANFYYCPLIWHFCSALAANKIENIHKRALRFVLNDFKSPYEILLSSAKKDPMRTIRLKFLCTEIFKCINNIGPSFMQNIFRLKADSRIMRTSYINNLIVPVKKTVTFGKKSISSIGPSVWNKLPAHMKLCKSLCNFKKMLKQWNGELCSCHLCNKKIYL